MYNLHRSAWWFLPDSLLKRCAAVFVGLVLCVALNGCVAITNPVANGVPVRRLPPELLGESRTDKKPLPLTSLRQKPPEAYRLASGDVLGAWIPSLRETP